MTHEDKLMYEVRPTTPDDLSALRHLQMRAWRQTYPSPENGVSHEWVKNRTDSWLTDEKMRESKEILEKILADPTQFHRVAVLEGKVVGLVHVSTKDDRSNELEGIYVDPDVFGKGAGARLMEAADVWIAGRQVTVGVVAYNQRAIRFYEKHGFKIVEGSQSLYGDMMPVVQMKREAIR